MKSKIVEIKLEDWEALIAKIRKKDEYITKLERSNKAYEEQIKIYKRYKDETQKV